MIPKNKLEAIREVNNQLTKETTLVIEEAFYKQMIIRDVSNLRRNLVNCREPKT